MANINFAKKSVSNTNVEKKVHKLLIVDDDQSIHDISKIAIDGMYFSDFELKVFSAYSAKEAEKILQEESDIALALIDVVMETPEAGLELVNYIRNDLENKLTRLIIRTGQANDFPQMQVIQQYDINDFKEKTELTIEKLYTTIRSSIKQYEQLVELQHKFEETYHQMTTNSLTLLPNRIKLIEDFSHTSQQTLILIDIVGFSSINDLNGYEVGDFVLKELGGFLSSMYSNKFHVYHLNNDLFALVPNQSQIEDLVDTIKRINEDISELKLITGNFNKTIETTIGVAYQTDDDVMRKAELALKEARNNGINKIQYYSNDLKVIQELANTHKWAPIISNAIKQGDLQAYAQPIYKIEGESNVLYKHELLVRLEKEGTIYSPYHFLDAAGRSGNLYSIFMFMFEEGCKRAAATGTSFSINISDCEFHNPELFEFIETTVKKYAVDPKLLSLEILEYNVITRSDAITKTIMAIHELGIEFIVDDFGVQCSNFAQAEYLPITTLKIDGSFIKNIVDSKNSQIVVKTIQTFAKEKGVKLIAEFVCDKEVYEKVKELGIEYVQGYYLGEPKP